MGGFDITSNWIISQRKRNIVFAMKGELFPLFNEC